MNPFFSQWIDRRAINYAASRMPKPDGRDLHVDEARCLLQQPEFFPANVDPAKIRFDGPIHFHFATARATAYPVNNVVPGRFYRCDERWREKPVILLLHGWNDVLNHRFFFPRSARQLNALGLSATTLQMPWHFDRRPRELGAWGGFFSADILHTLESILQALADIRSTVNWLLAEGCPSVGLWGISMGAWLAGLTVCHDARIGAAVLEVPAAHLDRMIKEVKFCESIRSVLQGANIDLSRLNLVSKHPVIAREKILLIEALDDLFVDKETVEELWRAWQEPEIWRYPCGHISVLGARGLANRVAQWLGRALK